MSRKGKTRREWSQPRSKGTEPTTAAGAMASA
jgi:hypothetical protein